MPIHRKPSFRWPSFRTPRFLLPLLLTLAALAAVFRAPVPGAHARLAGIAGPGSTGVMITNLDGVNSATAVVDYYKQSGGPPVSRTIPNIPPNDSYTVYLPIETALANGAYAVVVSSDRPVTTLVNTTWQPGGGSLEHGEIQPATEVIVPLVVKNYLGQTSIVNIQNTDTGAVATVTFDWMASGSKLPTATTNLTVSPGTSASVDVSKFSGLASIPDGSLGWARISSATPLAVVSYTDMETTAKGVYAVEGIPADTLAATLTAPMVASGGNGMTSGLSVLNPGDTAVDVNVTYTGLSGTCAGQTIAHDTASVGSGAIAVFYQGDISIPGTGRSHLPAGCYAAAKLAATGPIAAVVNLSNLDKGTSTAYPALRADQADQKVILPLMRKLFYGTTELQAVNTSGAAATVTLEYSVSSLSPSSPGVGQPFKSCGAECEVTIPAGGAWRWEFGNMNSIADRTLGTVRLISDQPLVATMLDVCDAGCGSNPRNDAVYNGAAIGAAGAPPHRRHVPLALRAFGDPVPTRTPGGDPATPTPGGQPTATPGSGESGGTGGIGGAGISGVQVVNLSRTDSTDISVVFQRHTGGAPVTVTREDVGPGKSANVYLPSESELQNGLYAAHVVSEQPVAAIARTDWNSVGGAVLGNAPEPATSVLVPFVTRGYNAQNSIIGIQNIDGANATTVQMELMQMGQTTPPKTLTLPLAAGAATTVDMGTRPELGDLPAGFLGWARLSASTPIAVTSLVNMENSQKGVYDIDGLPASRVAATLHAPMLFNNFQGMTSGISVLNPGTIPVMVKVTYHGAASGGLANTCQGQTIEHNGGATAMIPASASLVFYQGNINIPGSGQSNLPANCAASAVIESVGGGVLAVVNVASPTQGTTGAYSALTTGHGAERVHLPLIRREHTNRELTTPIQVQNLGGAPAGVTLTLRDDAGQAIACGADCVVTIPPGGSRLWWPPDVVAWQAGTYGTAQLDSDQPIAAVVDDLSLTGSIDQAIYVGLPEGGPNGRDLPLLSRLWQLRPLPSRTPTPVGTVPTPRPTGTPVPGGSYTLPGQSGIQFTNLSETDAADVSVSFTNQTTGASLTVSRPGIAPGASASVYLPAEANMPNGVFAARVSANQPVSVLANNTWNLTGHSVIYNALEPATDVLVPMLLKGFAGQTSALSIQNTAASATTAELQLMRQNETDPLAILSLPLGPGGATSFSLGAHPQLAGLPDNAILWGRVTADQPLAVLMTQTNMSSGTYSLAGQAAASAGMSWYVPMVFKDYWIDPANHVAGQLGTGITVLNPGPSTVGVKVTYQGADVAGRSHACQGQTIEHNGGAPVQLAPGAIHFFYPANDAAVPANCAASALIEATGGGIVATVRMNNQQSGAEAAFEAIPAGQGGQRVHLPLTRREHTSSKLTTPIQVQNLGASPATVTLAIQDWQDMAVNCGAACTVTIPPGGSRLWWPTDIADWPMNSYGSAVVTSDQPVAATVADLSLSNQFDMSAYLGVPANGSLGSALPLLLKGGRISDVPPITGPTPTPTPAPPLVGLPASMPAPVGGRISVPVAFDAGDYQVAELELTLDYDQSWLRFDPADGNGDGVPDAVGAALPAGFTVTVQHDATVANAELVIRVSSLGGSPRALPDGSWLTLQLDVIGEPGPRSGGLAFGPNKGVRLRDLEGNEIASRVAGGWSPNSQRVVLLPALFRNH